MMISDFPSMETDLDFIPTKETKMVLAFCGTVSVKPPLTSVPTPLPTPALTVAFWRGLPFGSDTIPLMVLVWANEEITENEPNIIKHILLKNFFLMASLSFCTLNVRADPCNKPMNSYPLLLLK